jgi:hypothetical protein
MRNKYEKGDFYEYFTPLLLLVKTRVTLECCVYCKEHHFKEFSVLLLL